MSDQLTSKKVSLLSCQFCGSNRVQVVRSFIDSDSNIVHCPHCDACGPRALSTEPEGTAEARWNASRATHETPATQDPLGYTYEVDGVMVDSIYHEQRDAEIFAADHRASGRQAEVIPLYERPPNETYERRLAEACERLRRCAALVAMSGDQSMALAINRHSVRLLADIPAWSERETCNDAAYIATCQGGAGGPCTQPDCEKCWPDPPSEKASEHHSLSSSAATARTIDRYFDGKPGASESELEERHE